jgi:arylsulfatase A-like enzyme
MDRREFVKKSGAGGAALMLAGAGSGAQAKRPNLLLFIVDQMREPRWFPESARLPNLTRLKDRGVAFTNHFVSAVPCSPSRACLMTGRHMDRNGVFNNMNAREQPSLDPAIPTLGHVFRQAGYRTPYFGKWHLSLKRDGAGLEPYGFDWIKPTPPRWPFPGLMGDGSVTDAALDWIKGPAGRGAPWFLTVSLINPHDICSYPRLDVPPFLVPDGTDRLPDNWNDDLANKPRCQREYQEAYAAVAGTMSLNDEKTWRHYLDYYYYLTAKTDQLLGCTLDALSASGQSDNTVVIFTSDHGDMGGSHRLRSKGPCAYRENVNVPLVIADPRGVQGLRCEALCQNVDLFPTLAAIAGADPSSLPSLPGHDLSPALTDPEGASFGDHALFSFTDNINVRLLNQRLGRQGVHSPHHIRAIRERDWLFARYFDPGNDEQEFELYDLKNDPLEMRNLAGDPGYSAQQREMAEKLREAEKE